VEVSDAMENMVVSLSLVCAHSVFSVNVGFVTQYLDS
jgi:hypothetical protein